MPDEEDAEREIRARQRLQAATTEELLRQRARDAAHEILRAERAATLGMPEETPLDEALKLADEPLRYRVDRLWPTHGRVILAAQFKAGKTTFVHNLVRSLADGAMFLDRFHVEPLVHGETLALLDNEMSAETQRRWLRDQAIHNPDRVILTCMRGQAASFDIVDDRRRAIWAARLRGRNTRVVILDCLGPALAALGFDEDNKGVSVFLDAFAALLGEAGIGEGMIVHHMGHANERSRGASRLRDWPDAEWKLVRDREEGEEQGENVDPSRQRFFSAYGRDVQVDESILKYDPIDRHVSVGNGDRKQNARDRNATDVLDYVREHPGQSQRDIESGTAGIVPRAAVRVALAWLIEHGDMRTEPGPRQARLHYATRWPEEDDENFGRQWDDEPPDAMLY